MSDNPGLTLCDQCLRRAIWTSPHEASEGRCTLTGAEYIVSFLIARQILTITPFMMQSTKAVLLSTLVFPGLGHIFLKKYVPGAILVTSSFTAAYYFITKAIERASQLVQQIQSGNTQLDVAAIAELVSKQSTGAEDQLLNFAMTTLFVCWIIAIIDSYRVGRIRDKQDESLANRSTQWP